MKTTIELPDDLLIEAKKRAIEMRTSLKVLVERGLRRELIEGGKPKPRKPRIQWVTVKGGLPEGVDPSDRASMVDWVRNDRD